MAIRSNHTISKDNFLKNFEREDYIWIIREQLKLQQSNVQLFDILSSSNNLESLAHLIYKEAANLNDKDFEFISKNTLIKGISHKLYSEMFKLYEAKERK